MVVTLAPTPMREARRGRSARACSTDPVRFTNCLNVTGPTFSVRISRSQASSCDGVRSLPAALIMSGRFSRLLVVADLRLGAVDQAADIGPMIVDEQGGKHRRG